jgi:hypothetical protein
MSGIGVLADSSADSNGLAGYFRLDEPLPRAASARFATNLAALFAVLPAAFAVVPAAFAVVPAALVSPVALLAVPPADLFTLWALLLAALRWRVAAAFFAAALRCAFV